MKSLDTLALQEQLREKELLEAQLFDAETGENEE